MNSNPSKEGQVDDVRELFFHVNEVFHTRVYILLIAESIFFAAIATLWNDKDKSLKLIVCGLGIVMTAILWFANATLHKRSNFLTDKLKEIDSIYQGYLDEVSLKYISVTAMLAHALPIVSPLAWILVVAVVLEVI